MSRPYGLRKGVIPIFIAWVISKLKKCILINYKQQEVELSAQVIEAINENPENFYFSIDEINASKIKYIEDLGTLFGCEIDSEIVKNYNLLTTSIVSWYVSLPKFTKQMIGIGDSISGKKYKMLRKQLNQTNINASEFILFSLPKLLGTNELDKAIVQLTLIKKNLDSFYEDYLSIIKKEVNEMIGFDKNTVLTQSLNYWIKQNKNLLEKQILESNIKDFIDICDNSLEETENSLINKIAYCFTTFFVEDWSSETHELFKNQLNKLILLLNEDAGEETKENTITLNIRGNVIVKEFDENIEDSLELVENFIDSTIEDYGDLLTNKQKISLLVRIMKKYL